MGRPRKWDSDAERKRHERGVPSPASVADETPEPHPENSEPRKGIPTEEEYVGVEVLATKLAIAHGLQDHDGHRLDRARAYARNRYRGFLAGALARL